MSSFRTSVPTAPPRRNRRNSIHGLLAPLTTNRPRSLGIYSNSPNSTNNPYTATTPSFNSSPYSSIPSYSMGYSSPYSSYSSPSGYNPTYNNYGMMSPSSYTPSPSAVASIMLNSLSLSKPTYSSGTYNSGNNTNGTGGRKSRQLSRNGSYGRDKSRSKSVTNSDMGSRSLSLTSLDSQGYVVSL